MSVDAVHERLTWEEEMDEAVRAVGALGEMVSATLFTVMVTPFDVVVLPAASRAVAESM